MYERKSERINAGMNEWTNEDLHWLCILGHLISWAGLLKFALWGTWAVRILKHFPWDFRPLWTVRAHRGAGRSYLHHWIHTDTTIGFPVRKLKSKSSYTVLDKEMGKNIFNMEIIFAQHITLKVKRPKAGGNIRHWQKKKKYYEGQLCKPCLIWRVKTVIHRSRSNFLFKYC